ncbi:hypothetical protein MRB53_040426 [Persea americana]|nr:hypothetical protein MRB53_040426 [Persea americana]
MTSTASAQDTFMEVSPVQKAISAISGAVVTSLIVTPLDVSFDSSESTTTDSRTESFASDVFASPDICVAEETALKRFSGTWEGLVKISRNEGMTSLWRGLSPTLFMAIPSTVIYFVGYEQLRSTVNNDAAWRRFYAVVLLERPLRRRHERDTNNGPNSRVEDIVARLDLTLWRDVPFSAVYWLGYERTKRTMIDVGVASPFLQSFLAGGISGTFAAFITTPFDVAKTKKQIVERAGANENMWNLMKTIRAEEGVRGLWRGLVPRCLKVSPACAIMISSYELGKKFFARPIDA